MDGLFEIFVNLILNVLWNGFLNLFKNTEDISDVSTDQTTPLDNEDSFLKLRSHATRVGGKTGLISTITGLLVAGFVLEAIFDIPANAANPNAGASGIMFISVGLIFLGYPLIGMAAGSFIGRGSIKREYPEENRAKSQKGVIVIRIIGFLIGTIPIILFLLYISR